ncbi:hypothetical protein FPV67DRAFT_301938 [Lyophyllum atratum]|nr:hypothetical protein FPV67DRAFT_301938 [Lyophyllum atratum]
MAQDAAKLTVRKSLTLNISGRSSKATISSMPAELLLAVFEYIHQARTAESSTSASLFPYSLASVCTSWRDIITSVPSYWTRVVIFIDKQPTGIYNARSLFRWSANLPVDVDIIRRTYIEQNDPSEGSRVSDILDVLRPHIYRCRSVRLDVLYSSTLPPISYFSCDAPLLTSLNMDCRIYDGSTRVGEEVPEKFKWPLLRQVSMDGQNFYELCRTGETHCLSRIFPNDGFGLSVSHFMPSKRRGPQLSLIDAMGALSAIRDLRYLRFRGIELHDDRSLYSFIPPDFVDLTELILEDLDAVTLDPILTLIPMPQTIFITRCSFFVTTDPPDCDFLTLVDIGVDQPIAQVLSTWNGHTVTFEDCPAFDDVFLGMMGGEERPDDEEFGCPNVQDLTISNCPNFSPSLLRKMMEARMVPDDYCAHPMILALKVQGLKPPLSSEDEEWFKSNIDDFVWDRDDEDGDSEAKSE